MNMNRIIQMVINQVLRRVVSGGVNAAINQVSRRTGSAAPQDDDQTRTAALSAKRARQAAKLTRKL